MEVSRNSIPASEVKFVFNLGREKCDVTVPFDIAGANVDLAMNALSSLMSERDAIAIRSKSLNYNYLTINESTASTLKFLMIGVFPLTYLTIGIFVIVHKRRQQNEPV